MYKRKIGNHNVSLDISESGTSIARNLHLPRWKNILATYIKGLILLALDQISVFVLLEKNICIDQCWENNIAYGKNPSKVSPWLLASAIRFMLYVNNVLASNRCRGTVTAGTFFNLYPDLCLKIVFPALKLTQNCYLHYNTNIFSLKLLI